MSTRHGADIAVVLSVEDSRKLEAAEPDFRDYLLSGPKGSFLLRLAKRTFPGLLVLEFPRTTRGRVEQVML